VKLKEKRREVKRRKIQRREEKRREIQKRKVQRKSEKVREVERNSEKRGEEKKRGEFKHVNIDFKDSLLSINLSVFYNIVSFNSFNKNGKESLKGICVVGKENLFVDSST
jgi:hypothetical protein